MQLSYTDKSRFSDKVCDAALTMLYVIKIHDERRCLGWLPVKQGAVSTKLFSAERPVVYKLRTRIEGSAGTE